jgi:lysozyme
MTYATGIDVSRWEDDLTTPYQPDLSKAWARGISFIGIKVSQNNWTDKLFVYFWQHAKELGLLRLPYHFFDYSLTKKTPAEQAKYFCEQIYKDPPEITPYLDYEEYAPWGDLPIVSKSLSYIQQFMETVDAQLGKSCGLYTNKSVIKYNLGANLTPTWLTKRPLWIANPSPIPPVIAPWSKWSFWQYTFVGDGIAYGMESKGLDLDYYNGTIDDLKKEFSTNVETPPFIEPTDAEKLKLIWDWYKQSHP